MVRMANFETLVSHEVAVVLVSARILYFTSGAWEHDKSTLTWYNF